MKKTDPERWPPTIRSSSTPTPESSDTKSSWFHLFRVPAAVRDSLCADPTFWMVMLIIIGIFTVSAIAQINSCSDPSISTGQHQELVAERNQRQHFEKLARDLEEDNISLQQMLAAAGETKQTVRYVVRTETKLLPSEPQIIYKDLPASYFHRVGPGGELVVGSFESLAEGFQFKTYELTMGSTVLVGKKGSSALTTMSSSYDGTTVEIPTTLQVVDVSPHRIFNPRLHIGLAASSTFEVYPYLGVSILSFGDNVSALAPGVGPLVGHLDVLRFNAGAPLPFIDDLWLGAGVNTDIVTAGAQLTLSSNL
jgi:hypothetical protein